MVGTGRGGLNLVVTAQVDVVHGNGPARVKGVCVKCNAAIVQSTVGLS